MYIYMSLVVFLLLYLALSAFYRKNKSIFTRVNEKGVFLLYSLIILCEPLAFLYADLVNTWAYWGYILIWFLSLIILQNQALKLKTKSTELFVKSKQFWIINFTPKILIGFIIYNLFIL